VKSGFRIGSRRWSSSAQPDRPRARSRSGPPLAPALDEPRARRRGRCGHRTAAAVVRHCRAPSRRPARRAWRSSSRRRASSAWARRAGPRWARSSQPRASTACSPSRMSSARRAGHRARLRAGAGGRDARPIRRRAWPRGRRLHANPLLGRDSLEPLIDAAVAAGAGLLRARADFQPGRGRGAGRGGARAAFPRAAGRDRRPVGASSVGAAGLSSVGAVTGSDQTGAARPPAPLMPRAIFLLPAWERRAAPSTRWRRHSAAPSGRPVTASRSIVNAHEQRGGDPARAAADAAEELRSRRLVHRT